jgi:hypothetical protein
LLLHYSVIYFLFYLDFLNQHVAILPLKIVPSSIYCSASSFYCCCYKILL